jgi:hypothetical protein
MSIDNKRSRYSDQTVGDWLENMPNELDVDAIGLWQIIPTGTREFGLAGLQLEEFIERAVLAILDRGAVPVKGNSNPEIGWRRFNDYGISKREITDNLVRFWLYNANREPDVEDLWFIMPHYING